MSFVKLRTLQIQFFNVSLNGKEWLRKSLQMSQSRHGGISRVDYFRKDLFFFSYPAKTTCIIVMERITRGLVCWWMTCLKWGFNPDIGQAASKERTCHVNVTRISQTRNQWIQSPERNVRSPITAFYGMMWRK